jgi:O-antigen/teichoic acid export membrane protein
MIKTKLLLQNISVSLALKVGSIFVGILAIPAYLNYFEDQSLLGGWFALLALFNWLLFFDLGLGNGLKNELIHNLADNNFAKAKELILSSYVVLLLLSTLIILIALLCYIYQPFSSINHNSIAIGIYNFDYVVLVTAFIVFIQFPLRLVVSILLAMQKSALANFLPFLSQLLVLVFLVTFNPYDDINNFLILTAVYGISICLPLLLATIYVFKIISSWGAASLSVKYNDAILLLITGSKFFWIQVCLLLVNGSNEFIILKFNNAEDVVQYQIYFKVFSIFLIAFSTLTVPLWSAIGQAKALKNPNRILKIDTMMRYILISSMFLMPLMCFILPYVFELWLGEGVIKHDNNTSLIFSLYVFVMMGINYSACIANGFNKLSIQLKCLSLAVVLKFFIIYLFPNLLTEWTDVVIITILSLLPAFIVQFVFSQKVLNSGLLNLN